LLAAVGLAALTVGLAACNQQSVEATLRSLQASSEVTFVCRGERLPTADDPQQILHDRGFELSACPDFGDPRTRTMLAVITQTATNELAVVSVDDQKVIDADLSVPGYTFLRLPSRPGDIVSSPGGEASFVGLTSTGKTGITAIPTTCLGPPRANADGVQHARDVTTFAACSLPSTPGDMVVMVEPPLNDTISESCAHPDVEQSKKPPGSIGTNDEGEVAGRDCVADLTTEGGPVGRRKLVVALPDEGKIKVIDAQWLLDQAPGSFGPCVFEGDGLELDVTPDATGQSQKPPQDFPDSVCAVPQPTPPPVPPSAVSRPSGLAAAADGRLFVGDLGLPAVHVLDASSPCKLRELPPLLPMSYATPSRLVTTSRVAVSPVTPSGKQFVYAVDAGDQPTTSVMAFDVSTDATERTPIMRVGSMRQPREAPDRIAFAAPVADIAFAYRDLPRSDLETGVAEIGVRCDPSPDASTDPPTPGVQYRTTGDFTQGARPQLLRGLFGLVMLTSGQVVVIDVDDFDADCRRPISTNATEQPDFRGCVRDPWVGPEGEDGTTEPYYLTYSPENPLATRTVTGEVSCNIVEPHRVRSASFGLSTPTLGLGAPSLRGFPRFAAPKSVVNSSAEDRPKLLAVPFESPIPGVEVPPQVYVGTTLHGQNGADTELPTDPSNTKDRSSLTLPLVEPRSYPSNERNVLVYEGRVLSGDQPSGFFTQTEEDGRIVLGLADPTAYFCSQGVYDGEAMATYASDVLGLDFAKELEDGDLDDTEAGRFGTAHSDYVQITGDFPSIIDSYWDSPRGREVGGRGQCEVVFGPPPRTGATELEAARDFTITAAHQGRLEVAPRTSVLAERFADLPVERWVTGCFPGGLRYTIRGGNQWVLANGRPDTLHDITADASRDYRCIRDCDPRKRFFRSRVFEIGSSGCDPDVAGKDTCAGLAVGPATELDGPCTYAPAVEKDKTRGITLAEPAAKCIFENLTSRFAVYRGRQPSVRDMIFGWDTAGGFVPLSASLASLSSAVLPQHLAYVPEYQAIAVVDGSTLGLSFMSLDSLRISDPWPVY
jgi:hypothetical protein